MSFVAGAYSAVYGSLNLGKIEDGITMSYRRFSERIQTDITGDAIQDGVYRGVELTLDFVLAEWDLQAVKNAFWPWATELGEIGRLGRLDTTMASALVLTACGTTTPNMITFHQALLSPNFDVNHLFANSHRKVALQMTVYPVSALSEGSSSGNDNQCEPMKLFTVA